MRAAFGLLVAACTSSTPPPAAPAAAPRDELRARCHAMTGHADDCMRDRACVTGGPATSCGDHVCTDGGPVACLPCGDFVALRGVPARFCELRAAGDDRGACEVLHPEARQRCDAQQP
ncbi:MAG: hypothetical protein ACM31C_22705 [Acidobacteriota bacterium]